jgi:hypothetical protein
MRYLQHGGVWHNAAFLKLWTGQTISSFGSAITRLALPLTAITILQVTPVQMGILGATSTLPVLLFSLFAGVWVDRVRRRGLLIGVEVAQALVLCSIPLLASFGLLSVDYLYGVGFLSGCLGLLFNLAYTSFLPSLVGRTDLVDSNSKLALSDSVASVLGPGLAGALLQVVSTPLALLVDAISFLISAVFLHLIRVEEAPPARSRRSSTLWTDIGEGLRMLFAHPLLRATTIGAALGSFAFSMQSTVLILFLTRQLHLAPIVVGAILASSGIAALGGALLAGPIARQFGIGPAIIWGTVLGAMGQLQSGESPPKRHTGWCAGSRQRRPTIRCHWYSTDWCSTRRCPGGRDWLAPDVADRGTRDGAFLRLVRALTIEDVPCSA